ncbi:hypothetical protein ACIOD2_33860 [Amycolatopsis sp. NPDC088138]|uniref:hypothetical protein n=1 Tax=Amycolatopsis sp. NPDC088138 TaxID=3363938 RepID=UPI00381EFB37
MTTNRPKNQRDAGQWLALDEDGLLYAIGDALYTGVSINNADLVVKKVVGPSVATARTTCTELRTTIRYNHDSFDVWVKPALGGRDGALIALQACYVPAGHPFPARPAIAVWEWEEPPPGNGESLLHWWGEDAPRFYGVEPPTAHWHGGATGRDPYRFMDSVLTEDFRVATTAVMQDFRDAEIDLPLIKFMEQRHAATKVARGVRAVGRKKSASYYVGFSMEVQLGLVQRTVAGPLLRQLGAYAAITTDPLIMVDAAHDSVALTSNDFALIDVGVPADSSLRSMVHPDDIERVLSLVHFAANNPGKRSRPVRVALKTRRELWLTVRMHAVGTNDSATRGRQFVMCRLEVLERASPPPGPDVCSPARSLLSTPGRRTVAVELRAVSGSGECAAGESAER